MNLFVSARQFYGIFSVLGLSLISCKSTSRESSVSADRLLDTKAERQGPLLDVNDVTVLFPTDSKNVDRTPPLISKSKPVFGTSGKPLPTLDIKKFMTQSLLDEVLLADESDLTKRATSEEEFIEVRPLMKELSNWHVVSFRFDPCAPSTALAFADVPSSMKPTIPGCLVQLRLIAQPLDTDGFDDHALHLVYNLGVVPKSSDTKELQKNFKPFMPVIAGLQNIKNASLQCGVNTDGLTLRVHPGLYECGDKVRSVTAAFLNDNLNVDKLSAIAVFGLGDASARWVFLSGKIHRDAKGVAHFTQEKNPGFHKSDVFAMAFRATSADIGEVDDAVFPIAEDSTRSLANHLNRGNFDQPQVAFEVDHPARSHVFNTDCVSCHQTREAINSGKYKASSHPDRYLIPQGISGYPAGYLKRDLLYNLRNLGYMFQEPSINNRTATETAAVVDLTNRIIAGDNVKHPGLDCGTNRKVLDEIMDCNNRTDADDRECFKSCKVVGQ